MAVTSKVQLADEELTSNLNYLQPTGFKVIIDRTRYPNLEYFVQSVSHPGASLTPIELPVRRITSVPLAGDKMTFSEVGFDIIVDENMTSYKEMYDWMTRIVNEGQVSAGERDTKKPTYADITLSVLSSHNNTVQKIRYLDCVPTTLGAIEFQSTSGDTTFVTFNASFRFSQFEIV
jgi:hypothetical protein|tara:strand:+ start:4901 stop:5428 length:528 start_codon:yes stop_codon:yes gene_type:complete